VGIDVQSTDDAIREKEWERERAVHSQPTDARSEARPLRLAAEVA
jgi:hypothetical protein